MTASLRTEAAKSFKADLKTKRIRGSEKLARAAIAFVRMIVSGSFITDNNASITSGRGIWAKASTASKRVSGLDNNGLRASIAGCPILPKACAAIALRSSSSVICKQSTRAKTTRG